MKLLAIVVILGVVALMTWVSLRVNHLSELVTKLEKAWKKEEEDEA
ncbi:MAG: hypothetical protein RL318_1999 [Fibrobacterota bacterium]|jgi:hypothetical protein